MAQRRGPEPAGNLRDREAILDNAMLELDSELSPSSFVEIAPFLRVANEVASNRVAYLCQFYAFEKAHKLDPKLQGRLERVNEASDAREMQTFYQDYYQKYIEALRNADDKADRAQLTKAYQTLVVLFEVLKAVNQTEDVEVADEIQATVLALRNTRGLPWPANHNKKLDEDMLDWLQTMFGFQKDNVSNQREHLILLVANVHIQQFLRPGQQPKLDDHALITIVMNKLFKNYKKWCKYLGRKSSLRMPTLQREVQQRKVLYIGLYLLIWGEAANMRFMPECLCYIYHHMAFELDMVLGGSVSPMTGEPLKPAYGGGDECFLQKVLNPIHQTVAKEAKRSRGGKSKHSEWRNYDVLNEYFRSRGGKSSKHSEWRYYDKLNEYFWSTRCFRLGWPMRADADFFYYTADELGLQKTVVQFKRMKRWILLRLM